MKQHITVEQLNELSDKGKESLREWWQPQVGDMVFWLDITGPLTEDGEGYWDDLTSDDWKKDEYLPLLSIGQMIEYLNWKSVYFYLADDNETYNLRDGNHEDYVKSYQSASLCDALWQAVKQDLETD